MPDCLMVTVLTPTYNRANTLPKLVDSLSKSYGQICLAHSCRSCQN